MNVMAISHLAKSFGRTQAVADVSFEVGRGEIFGLLGPNGAGKTTTIRMLLDIYRPDSGSISILDGPMTEAKKDRIGYMPEERGLYQDIALETCLVYLSVLKGLSRNAAHRQVGAYLERFDLARYRTKKVKELSKGMQQKAQIIAAIAHGPELLIIDEPFASLDPVNARLVTDLIRQLAQDGTTILMSTHQMHQVEELCDRIVLINEGRNVLYGDLDGIRRRYAGNELLLHTAGRIPQLDGIAYVSRQNSDLRLTLAAGTTPQDVLAQLVAAQVRLEKFEVAMPTLDEIFVRVVTGAGERGDADG
ncbi:MAG: ATP-binding cassette domain-containing protein [Anaerolineae bacterium]|nr:ATP-binding cassette domain-containing protein [Anaerolineae bacterium]